MSNDAMNRREWIAAAGAVGLAVSAGLPKPAAAQTSRVPGVQLYTVRDSMADDVSRTLGAVAGIGYREVEFAGYFGHSAAEIRKLLSRYELTSPSTHVDGSLLRADAGALDKLLDDAAEIGHDYVTIAWVEEGARETMADWRRWADDANRLGELCRQRGLRAAYHNHDFEFAPIDGIEPFDFLLRETDPALVDFELDFYWVRKAGLTIEDVLSRAPERITMAHIKDIDAAGTIVDVGTGQIDFAGILNAPAAASIRHAFVEHDHSDDPFRTIAFGHYVLKSILD